jgi:uncharacterized protein YqeY
MDLQARVDEELKAAMKARDADRLSVLRMLKSALKNAAIEAGGAEVRLDESTALAVVRKESKKRHDAIEGFTKGNRPELAAKERAELEMLGTFLPKPFSPEEIAALLDRCIAETGATGKAQMGLVMKRATELAGGRVDGKTLSQTLSPRLT